MNFIHLAFETSLYIYDEAEQRMNASEDMAADVIKAVPSAMLMNYAIQQCAGKT